MWKMTEIKEARHYNAEFPNGDFGFITIWLNEDGSMQGRDPILGGPVNWSYSDGADWILRGGNCSSFLEALTKVYAYADENEAWNPNCWNDNGHEILALKDAGKPSSIHVPPRPEDLM